MLKHYLERTPRRVYARWISDFPWVPFKLWSKAAKPNLARQIFFLTLIGQLVPQIIQAESSGNARAVGDHGRARGLMQIQEATWKQYTAEPWSRAFDPDLNVKVGTRILRQIEARYGSRATAALVIYSYNTGRFCKGSLPPWTKKHPNRIYRKIFQAA